MDSKDPPFIKHFTAITLKPHQNIHNTLKLKLRFKLAARPEEPLGVSSLRIRATHQRVDMRLVPYQALGTLRMRLTPQHIDLPPVPDAW